MGKNELAYRRGLFSEHLDGVYSLGVVAEFVVVDEVVAATHGHPQAVPVLLDEVVGYFAVENLQQRNSGVAVVVDVVI